jgi:hypothetical protein
MRANTLMVKALGGLLLAAALAGAQAQTDYTELASPTGSQSFGWEFGGLPDLTRDGVGEFYVLETRRVYVYDGTTLQPLYSFAGGCGIGIPTRSGGDLNGDGIPELLLGRRCADQFGQVVVIDGANGTEMLMLHSPNPVTLGFFGHTLRLLPDLSGDGREDWLIHQPEFGSRTGRVYIFNSQTLEPARTLGNTAGGYSFWMQWVEVISDVDGDGQPELLVSGDGRAVVRSLSTGSVLYELTDPEPSAGGGFGQAFKGIGDITGDNVGEIAVGNFMRNNNTGVVHFFSGADGRWLRSLRSPNPRSGGKFGRVVEVLPDLNGDEVPELWTQEDGVQLTYIYDGATGVLLKTIPYPGVFQNLFFTGTVRQEGTPGIRGYMFASEFVNNSEGRVYFLPFAPIEPNRLRPMSKVADVFRLQVTGEPDLKFEIQVSSDFASWEPLAVVTTAREPVEVEVPASHEARRFYRAFRRE